MDKLLAKSGQPWKPRLPAEEDDAGIANRVRKNCNKQPRELVQFRKGRFVFRPGGGWPLHELAEYQVNTPAAFAGELGNLSSKKWWNGELQADFIACASRHFGWSPEALDCCKWLRPAPRPETSGPVIVADPLKVAGFLAALLERMAKQ